MTVKQAYEAVLVELDKTTAPNFLLNDFNYYINKAIQQFVNKKYNLCEINQQVSDDLRVLKVTSSLTNTNSNKFTLPEDYLHCLNCLCYFKVLKNFGCYKENQYLQINAKRFTSDIYSQAINNFYNQPSYRCPYYSIYTQNGDAFIEIKFLQNDNITLDNISIDYIKTPKQITLTEMQLDLVEDVSEELEFPDYVCYEILNELVKLFLENSSSPRLQTNMAVNQTIALPIQQQSQTNKK